jgi:hypothetical protein
MIIGIHGKIGSGKTRCAQAIAQLGNFQIISYADPGKRFCMEAYDFTEDQLWGPSELRDVVDPYWGFSSRTALKEILTGIGQKLHKHTWSRLALKIAHELLNKNYVYSRTHGIIKSTYNNLKVDGVIIEDLRHMHEFQDLTKDPLGFTVKLLREGRSLPETDAKHISETDLDKIPTTDFDYILDNRCTLDELPSKTKEMIAHFQLVLQIASRNPTVTL